METVSKHTELPEWSQIFQPPFYYDRHGQMILDKNGNSSLDVRGWGRAEKIKNGDMLQDAFGEYASEAVNNYYSLKEQIHTLTIDRDSYKESYETLRKVTTAQGQLIDNAMEYVRENERLKGELERLKVDNERLQKVRLSYNSLVERLVMAQTESSAAADPSEAYRHLMSEINSAIKETAWPALQSSESKTEK